MKKIIILGAGCSNCKTTFALIEKTVGEIGVEAEIVKEEDIAEIIRYGVMATPAVVIDGIVVHSGGIPTETEIKKWFD